MTERVSIDTFTRLSRNTERVSDLWQHALDFFHSRGIVMVSYHSDDAQMPNSRKLGIVADGFPPEWVCQYMETELSKLDPIPTLAHQLARPFLWSEVETLAELDDGARAYLDALDKAHLGDGVALEVFGPNLRNAYVGLGFGEGGITPAPQDIFELQCGAQIAHIRYCELTEARQELLSSLSPRELEVLRWIARGKSNSVIAEILDISRHTVDTMTRRMFEKLKVNDRTTAAIRGLGSGLLNRREAE